MSGAAAKRAKVRTGGTLMRQPGAAEKWAQFVKDNAHRYTPEKCAEMLDSDARGLGRLLSFVNYGRGGVAPDPDPVID